MPENKIQFWYNKAEDFSSSAFVLLWKAAAEVSDIVVINTGNNTVSAYASYEGTVNFTQIEKTVQPLGLTGNTVSVKKIEDHHKTVIIPKSLFAEQDATKIYAFNFAQTQSPVIQHSPVFNANHVLLYENFFHTPGKPAVHILEGLLEYVNTHKNNDITLVYVSYNYFTIVRKNNQSLSFVNSFEYQTSEDFIYYLLFTLEQLEFDTANETLHYFGHFERESAIHKLIKQYFPKHTLMTQIPSVIFPQEIPAQLHHRLIPVSLPLLCE